MVEKRFQVRFWGARGSVPVSGAEYDLYGGNTACIEITCGDYAFLIDAGSGLREAGDAVARRRTPEIDLFLTHCHYDHVVGLPFFRALYDPSVKLNLWSGHTAGLMTTQRLLCDFMRPPWFPVEAQCCTSNIDCRDFMPGDTLQPHAGVTLKTMPLNHPGGCIGYRVEWNGRAVVHVSDTEHTPGTLDKGILAFIEKADLVIYDSTYTDAEMQRYHGFGHSSWQQGIRLCREAGAKRLALFHHDPWRTDPQLSSIEAQAKAEFAEAFAARDGLTLDV